MEDFAKKNNSVFLSPPLSNEYIPSKSVSKIALIQQTGGRPVFLLDDNDGVHHDRHHHHQEEDDIKIDILEELLKRSLVPVIGAKILDYLSDDKHLLRVSHVSSNWRSIIQIHLKSGRRLRRYIKRKKLLAVTTKENQDQACKFKKSQDKSLSIGMPLRQFNEQVELKQIELSEQGPSTPIIKNPKSSYRHCPECHSPSRTTFKQVGHCIQCKQDFCLHCFHTNSKHSPTCVIIGGSGVSGSPRKLDKSSSRNYSMSSKESKARLKRY